MEKMNNIEYYEEFRQFSYFWGGKTVLEGIEIAFESIKKNENLSDAQKLDCLTRIVNSSKESLIEQIEKLPHCKLWLSDLKKTDK